MAGPKTHARRTNHEHGSVIGRTARPPRCARVPGAWLAIAAALLTACDSSSVHGTQRQIMSHVMCSGPIRCAGRTQLACNGMLCVNTVGNGARCALDPCVDSDDFRDTCDDGLACVHDDGAGSGARVTTGTCTPARPTGTAFSCRGWDDTTSCEQWQFCKVYARDADARANYACALDPEARTLLATDGGAPASFAVCVLPAPEAVPCDSNWSDTVAAGAPRGGAPRCSPCAPGLACIGGICRRDCHNDDHNCPCTPSGKWICRRWDGTNGVTVCGPRAPLGGTCGTVTDGGVVTPNGRICSDPFVSHCGTNGVCGLENGERCAASWLCAGGLCLAGGCATCIPSASGVRARTDVRECHSPYECCAPRPAPGGTVDTTSDDCVPIAGSATHAICCPTGWVNCGDTNDVHRLCLDIRNDPDNCGGCNVRCGDRPCVGGHCG